MTTPIRFSLVAFVAVLLPVLASAACDSGGYFTIHDRTPGRPVGGSCQVDSECDAGRCVAGICDDGSCHTDQDCRTDEICVFGTCEKSDEFACKAGQAPIINVTPLSTEFGEVALGTTHQKKVTVTNIGDCLLTLSNIGLDVNGQPGFSCDQCDVTLFPERIPPQRSLDINVSYSPASPGEASNKLLILGDDTTAGDNGTVSVDLHASYSGNPVLAVEPAEINFGFVPFVQGAGGGGTSTQHLHILNRGTGNAALQIQFIFISPPGDFTVPAEFANISPANPKLLGPYNPNDPATDIDVPVTFHPSRNANQTADLTVVAVGPDGTPRNLSAHLTASSLGPPEINVCTNASCGSAVTNLEFKQDDGTAYSVGEVAFRQITISNSGQSDLNVNLVLAGEASDFSVSPSFVPPIAPGGAIILSVFFNPSSPSDPANPHAPARPFNGVLNIQSNDTDPAPDALRVVSLHGWAKGGTFDDVLKLEMTYEHADNSWAANDFRKVDLEFISDNFGLSCAKPIQTFTETPPGSHNYVATNTQDLCAEWNTFSQLGHVSYIALGQYEEPERVVLFGLGQDLANGQTFTARVHFTEDCSNMPTGVLGDVLGIGVSALFAVLGGEIGVPIAVPPDQISNLITQNCWDHSSSLVTLHVSINGQEIAAPQQRIQHKGDHIDIVRLRRTDGRFEIVQ